VFLFLQALSRLAREYRNTRFTAENFFRRA